MGGERGGRGGKDDGGGEEEEKKRREKIRPNGQCTCEITLIIEKLVKGKTLPASVMIMVIIAFYVFLSYKLPFVLPVARTLTSRQCIETFLAHLG
ncbi:Protein of unknown function [Gryllus bimaculatus]|nr:Protein of unknown function [Gryllus bimaculatus]